MRTLAEAVAVRPETTTVSAPASRRDTEGAVRVVADAGLPTPADSASTGASMPTARSATVRARPRPISSSPTETGPECPG